MNIDQTKNYVRCASFEKSPKSYKDKGIEIPIEHTEVIRLLDNVKDFLPFEYVHLGFLRDRVIGEYVSGVSTGCAFFPDKITAIWKSICEVVERDTLMRFWYLNFSNAKRIETISILNYDVLERLKRIRERELKIHLFEISNSIDIPVVLCVVEGAVFPYYCCGVSCDSNIITATAKAIDEAISIRAMAVWNGFKKEEIDTNSFEWINRLEAHMELYANWENSPIMKTLIEKEMDCIDITNFKSNPLFKKVTTYDDLKNIAMNFKEKGFDIYYKDLTLPEVEKMGYVIKVVIPQMIPLAQSYQTRWLEPFIKDGIDISTINPYPQPFS
jgi:thiazole/oxazole-forming peptide maturase SagD family component